MKAIALAIVLGVIATGCNGVFGSGIQGSGTQATRNVGVGSGKAVPAFKKIQLEGSFDLTTKNGPQSDLVVTGDDNLVDLVKFSVSGDTLTIKTTESYSTKLPLKVAVTLPDLQGVSIDGSGNAGIEGIHAADASFAINGSGDITVTGTADSLSGSIDGSGDIDLSAVTAKKANASINGSGTIKVNASDSLNASVSGSGDILYKGSPKDLGKSINGSGDIKPLN